MTRLSQFIGDYSQNVEFCSYNEDDVRHLWRTRTLTVTAARVASYDPYLWSERWLTYNAQTDLDEVMDNLVRKAGGWPQHWNPHYARGIDLLCKGEIEMLGKDTVFPLSDILTRIIEQTKNSSDMDYDQQELLLKAYKEAES